MTITKGNGFKAKLSGIERNAFMNLITYIINDLEYELSTRTGFSVNDYNSFLTILNKNQEDYYIFSEKHLCMLHQAFNEIINGIYIPNFESTIGLSLVDAKNIFEKIDRLTSK